MERDQKKILSGFHDILHEARESYDVAGVDRDDLDRMPSIHWPQKPEIKSYRS
jgi:hypothetical protein